jgi:hypothetical protein
MLVNSNGLRWCKCTNCLFVSGAAPATGGAAVEEKFFRIPSTTLDLTSPATPPSPRCHSILPTRTSSARIACILSFSHHTACTPPHPYATTEHTGGLLRTAPSACPAGPARFPSHGPSWLGDCTLMSERCAEGYPVKMLVCVDLGAVA